MNHTSYGLFTYECKSLDIYFSVQAVNALGDGEVKSLTVVGMPLVLTFLKNTESLVFVFPRKLIKSAGMSIVVLLCKRFRLLQDLICVLQQTLHVVTMVRTTTVYGQQVDHI